MNDSLTKEPKRSRTIARVAAVQALFQCEQGQENAETVINQFIRHRLAVEGRGAFEEGQVPDADLQLFCRIVRGVSLDQDAIDASLTDTLSESWPLQRLDPVLRALLRSGVWELGTDLPIRVVINEYLDVAHGFFSGDETKMVNGILDKLGRAREATVVHGGSPAASGN